jgi:hypothetical protein
MLSRWELISSVKGSASKASSVSSIKRSPKRKRHREYIGVEKRKDAQASCDHTMERSRASEQKNQRIIRWKEGMKRMTLDNGATERSRVGRRETGSQWI